MDITSIIQAGMGAAAGASLSLTDAWQALVGDRVTAYRLSNAIKLQPKVAAQLAAAGLKINAAKVPDRFAFAWFEEATKQDEEEIQDIFAKLLAQAASGNADAMDRRLLDIVTNFTPSDALVFKGIYGTVNWQKRKSFGSLSEKWSLYVVHRIAKDLVGDDAKKTVEHLINLGVISYAYEVDKKKIANTLRFSLTDARHLDLSKVEIRDYAVSTALGVSLYMALYPDL